MGTVLITGSNGQLGQEIAKQLGSSAIARNKEQLDVVDLATTTNWLKTIKPDMVINTTAYTDSLNAQRPVMRFHAWAVNVGAAANMATVCAALKIPFMQVSCESVYGGDVSRSTAYTERDPVFPCNWCGETKAAAEHAILSLAVTVPEFRFWIIRTGLLFSKPKDCPNRANNAYTLCANDSTNRKIPAANDSYRSYAFAPHAAMAIAQMAKNNKDVPNGIYHISNGNSTAFDFYSSVVRSAGLRSYIEPVDRSYISERLGVPDTNIPKFSGLSTAKAKNLNLFNLPELFDAVDLCFTKRRVAC